MASDNEQALPKPWASPGPSAGLGGSTSTGSVGSSRRTRAAVRLLALPITDTAALMTAALVSGAGRGTKGSLFCALYTVAVLVIFAAGWQYRLRICLRVSDQIGRILTATTVPVLALLAWLPPTRVLWLALWSGGLVFLYRGLLYTALRAAHRRGLLTESAVVIGVGTFGAYVCDLIHKHPELGLRLVGLLDDGPPRQDLSVPSLGRPADLADVVRRLDIRRVIVCFSSTCRDEDIVALMRANPPLRAIVYVVPRLYELGMAVPRGYLDELWGIPLIPLRSLSPSHAALMLKRVFDVVVSAMLLAVAAPLMVALAITVRLRTGQTAIFRQARVTRNGRVAPIMKLRTLAVHDDHETRWTATEHGSPLGRWLRATHLDEVPQLANVLRGDMSLVGPRPERPYFAERFNREIPRYEGRTRMPAGITGWAQVNGLNGDTSIFERARFDNYYVEYWSVWLDLVILARTLVTLIRGNRRVRP